VAKHILLAKSAPEGQQGKTLGQVSEALSGWLQSRPWIERCALHVRTEIGAAPRDPAKGKGFDVGVELWTSREPMDWEAEIGAAPLHDTAGYQLEEYIEKGDGVFPLGPAEGVTLVSFIWPAPGVAISEVRARYGRHAPLARRVHVGMAHYSRNWIERVSTPGSIPFNGVSVLRFPTDQIYLEQQYESDQGRAAVIYDVRGFLDFDKLLSFNARSQVLR
jgi:hypothetical protein